MAERVAAFPVRVGQAMVKRLEDHLAANREQWLFPPATIDFGLKSSWEQGPFPLLGVHVPDLEDQTVAALFNTQGGRAELRIAIFAYLGGVGPDNPELALHELVADVRRAFADVDEGRQLGGVLSSGVMFFDGWTIGVDDSGFAVGLLGFRGLFDWDESAA